MALLVRRRLRLLQVRERTTVKHFKFDGVAIGSFENHKGRTVLSLAG